MTPSSPRPPRSTGKRVVVNTASLASASLWRIGIAFLIQVAIARWLGAAALGNYAIVLAWLFVAQICLESGLPAYSVRHLAGRPEQRRATHHQILRIQVVLSLAAWAGMACIAVLVPALRERLPFMALAGASLPFYAVLSAAGTIFEASERMDRVFLVDGVTNTILLAATLLVLWAGMGVAATLAGLVVVQIFSAILATSLLSTGGFLTGSAGAPIAPWRQTLAAARPFFLLSLADVLQQRADLLLLSAIASPQIAGVYAAANALARVLIKVVQAYWRALYPTLSRLRDSALDGYRALGDMAQRFLLAVMLPAAFIGASISGGVTALLYGDPYSESVPALAILLLSAPLYAWELRAVTALLAEHQPRKGLWIAVAHLLAMVVLLPPLTMIYGATGAALAATLAAACGAAAATLLAWSLPAAPADRRLLWMVTAALLGAGTSLLLQQAGLAWWAAGACALLLFTLGIVLTGALSGEDLRRLTGSIAPKNG